MTPHTTTLSPSRRFTYIPDPWAEAQRKYKKKGSRVQTAVAMFPSSFRGSLLLYSATFLVDESILMYAYACKMYGHAFGKKDKKAERPVARRAGFCAESLENLARCMGSVMLEGVGAALGTLIAPGPGTYVLQLLGSLVCWLI